MPGIGEVTKNEQLKHEVVLLLCKGPTPFSKLDKHLPEDYNDEIALENVIKSVANFK